MTDGSHWHDFSPAASEEAARFAHALAGELPGALRILADAGDIEALKLLLSRLASHTMRPVQIEIDGPAVHLSIWRALAARHTGVPVSVSRVNLREARASSEQRAAITVVLASAGLLALTATLGAQWPPHPTGRWPRTADGKVDLAAPGPRTARYGQPSTTAGRRR